MMIRSWILRLGHEEHFYKAWTCVTLFEPGSRLVELVCAVECETRPALTEETVKLFVRVRVHAWYS
jgi:GAF domain-containing protein